MNLYNPNLSHKLATSFFCKEDGQAIDDCFLVLMMGRFNSIDELHNYISQFSRKCTNTSFGTKKLFFKCEECSLNLRSCICFKCFVNGNHKNHRCSFFYSDGATCDCGNQQQWKKEGFCYSHSCEFDVLKLHKFDDDFSYRSKVVFSAIYEALPTLCLSFPQRAIPVLNLLTEFFKTAVKFSEVALESNAFECFQQIIQNITDISHPIIPFIIESYQLLSDNPKFITQFSEFYLMKYSERFLMKVLFQLEREYSLPLNNFINHILMINSNLISDHIYINFINIYVENLEKMFKEHFLNETDRIRKKEGLHYQESSKEKIKFDGNTNYMFYCLEIIRHAAQDHPSVFKEVYNRFFNNFIEINDILFEKRYHYVNTGRPITINNYILKDIKFSCLWANFYLKFIYVFSFKTEYVEIDELLSLLDIFFQNYWVDDIFDINNANNENNNNTLNDNNTVDNMNNQLDYRIAKPPTRRSIHSGDAYLTLFNPFQNILTGFLLSNGIQVIQGKTSQEFLLHSCILPVRYLSWNYLHLLQLLPYDETLLNFFFERIQTQNDFSYNFFLSSNFKLIQTSIVLIDNCEPIANLIASTLGFFDNLHLQNNELDTIGIPKELIYIFFFLILTLFYDRKYVGDNNDLEHIIVTSLAISLYEKDKTMMQLCNELSYEEYLISHFISKVADTIHGNSTYYKLKSTYIINPFQKNIEFKNVMTYISKYNGNIIKMPQIDHISSDGYNFHKILETRTVFGLVYAVLHSFVFLDNQTPELLKLSFIVLSTFNTNIPILQENENLNDNSQIHQASNLDSLISIVKDIFEEFCQQKIIYKATKPCSLFDLLKSLGQEGEIILNLFTKNSALNKNSLDCNTLNIQNKKSISEEKEKKKRIKLMKKNILSQFHNQILEFRLSNEHQIDEDNDEEHDGENENDDICCICKAFKDNDTIGFPIFIYETNLPSRFDTPVNGESETVFGFTLCNHKAHLSCLSPDNNSNSNSNFGNNENHRNNQHEDINDDESGSSNDNNNEIMSDPCEFECPIDRTIKNNFLPFIRNEYDELNDEDVNSIENFLLTNDFYNEKIVKSLASLIVIAEQRFRNYPLGLNDSRFKILLHQLFLILWHAEKYFPIQFEYSEMTSFQKFICSLIESLDPITELKRLSLSQINQIDSNEEKVLFLRRCFLAMRLMVDEFIDISKISIDQNFLDYDNLLNFFLIENDEIRYYFSVQYDFSFNNDNKIIMFLPHDFFQINIKDIPIDIYEDFALDLENAEMVNKESHVTQESLLYGLRRRMFPLFLMFIGKNNTDVVVYYRMKVAHIHPFYLRENGESDIGLKTYNFMTLDEDMLKMAIDNFISGDFTRNLKSIFQ
ncbi:hypothetical protein TRFO_25629 [Tritrichomonas foetus]|uniref:E3 ubiquitin-protein ligase n=1 Tax=Tritrichomonas foetus TaxID=1144522 RepID=A0A1J4K523_9EUKA|nr:hypothetical protein TRFO_25629 [Tritrichomonas foetus]|eukprot:OHT06299.1 hypothetical protein TRFO_25629 [Tritrichomonas foetus]